MTEKRKRDLPYRPALGLAVIIAGVILLVLGAFLNYRDKRTGADNGFFSAGGLLIALGATGIVTGFMMRRPD